MNRKLRTKDGCLTFRLRHEADDTEPLIIVCRGNFQFPAYQLSTIDHTEWDEGAPLNGWCVQSHRYDGEVIVSERAHKALVREAHKLLGGV